ncbi:hypothetical protein DPMN_047955 [Dreissena polymorpha]|uniref:Uncharacterized protein n=1 Tax=Dreissena polymorpha TaxID=45954 RepID=A0A9D4I1W6_DREPO|nr:hypothetical protein DPMN_047955 [Dreissena polymorpha]
MDGGNRSVVHRPDNGSWPNALALDTNSTGVPYCGSIGHCRLGYYLKVLRAL